MAINKKLIHFKHKENFDSEVAKGNILGTSIVFIQDAKEISTHGTVYKTVNWSVLEPSKISFEIDNVTFIAEEGMTWETWVNSDYNTNSVSIDGNYVIINGSRVTSENTSVLKTEIIESISYTTTHGGGEPI